MFVIIAAMVMERLDAAGKHPDNQEPIQQFAIKEAKRLLRSAGVVDPGPKDTKPPAGKVLPGVDSFIPQHGEVLNPEFAESVRGVLLRLPLDLPFGALRYWNKAKRREEINRGYPERFVEVLKELSDAPDEWVTFMESLASAKRQQVAVAFSHVLRHSQYEIRRSVEPVNLGTPVADVAEKLSLSERKSEWGKSEYFVVAAFRDLASG